MKTGRLSGSFPEKGNGKFGRRGLESMTFLWYNTSRRTHDDYEKRYAK